MNIVKTNLLLLTLGLSLAAGSVKADPLCKFITEADLVKNMSNVELVGKFLNDRTIQALGGYAGAELWARGIDALAKGAKIGSIAALAFIKKHPYITGVTGYLAVSAACAGVVAWLEAKKNKENKRALERQIAERESQREQVSKQAAQLCV